MRRNLAEGEARFCFNNTSHSTFIPSIDTLDMMIKAAYLNVASHAYFTQPPRGTVSPLRRWWKQSEVRKVWKSLPLHRAEPQQRGQRSADVVMRTARCWCASRLWAPTRCTTTHRHSA